MTEPREEGKPLAGRVALVTGGCGGLGQATAQRLTRDGATVVISDLDAGLGAEIADTLGVHFVQQDVSSEAAWRGVTAALSEQYEGLDILVNNAAILRADNIESETLEQFQRVMAVNCESVFLGIQHCLPLMSRPGAAIINVCSSSAEMGYPQFCAYTASKAAVRSLTMSTAIYLKQQGRAIRCNSVHPDGIITPMVMDIAGEPPVMSREMSMQAASFACEPAAVADVIGFLASDEARHINGAAIRVDNTSTIHPPYW
jgi:3(or 17)beta-hydroxysteroid dehydrogenase